MVGESSSVAPAVWPPRTRVFFTPDLMLHVADEWGGTSVKWSPTAWLIACSTAWERWRELSEPTAQHQPEVR
jgi:hypothetical protein